MKLLYSKIIGQGKPLVIMHGYLGMSDNWKTLGTSFAEQGFEVHLLDLRNHGRSFQTKEFSYELMVEDVLFYCKEHQLENIALLGHSMGGKLAMNLAVSHPELIEKLIVADISPRTYKPHHQQIMQALNAVDFSVKPSRTQVEEIMSQYIKDYNTLQFLMKSVYRKTSEQLAFRFNLEAFNADDTVIGQGISLDEKFNKPTLFLKGEKSNYIQDSDKETIFQIFECAEIEIVSNSGHWINSDNPKEFFQKVISFLRK